MENAQRNQSPWDTNNSNLRQICLISPTLSLQHGQDTNVHILLS